MEPIRWITIMFSVLLCKANTSSLKKPELKRVKRWEGTGDMSNMFRGTAGVDYPDYKTIPTTHFRCSQQEYEGGLYADVETQCQGNMGHIDPFHFKATFQPLYKFTGNTATTIIYTSIVIVHRSLEENRDLLNKVYHVCHDGRKDSFLCGRGTIFNQQILACDYWYSTECDTAPSFYYLNSQIGNPGSSWVPQGGDPQHNTQTNNQGSNYGQNYPQTGNQETDYGQNYPQSGNQDANYQANNDPGKNPNLENSKNDGNSGTDKDEKSCCCLKNTYKAPWNFPAFPGSQSKK